MSNSSAFSSDSERLEKLDLPISRGGLYKRTNDGYQQSSQNDGKQDEFPKPSMKPKATSLLGLDVLAKQKRMEQGKSNPTGIGLGLASFTRDDMLGKNVDDDVKESDNHFSNESIQKTSGKSYRKRENHDEDESGKRFRRDETNYDGDRRYDDRVERDSRSRTYSQHSQSYQSRDRYSNRDEPRKDGREYDRKSCYESDRSRDYRNSNHRDNKDNRDNSSYKSNTTVTSDPYSQRRSEMSNSTKGIPMRSSISLSKDSWEVPERLMSVKRNQDSSSSSISGSTDKESRSEWEAPTPLRSIADSTDIMTQNTSLSSYTPKTTITNRAMRRAGFIVDEEKVDEPPSPPKADKEEDVEDEDFDRDFYLSEEGNVAASGDDGANTKFLGNPLKFQQREEQMAKSRARGDTKIAGMSAKMSQLHADQEAWEDNRLIQSGVAVLKEVQTHFEDDDDARVQLIVHTLKPPFLDGRITFSMIQSSVSIVKDPTADMAVNARNGSAVLRDMREKREQMKMRTRFWELGGSKMGDAMGIPAPEQKSDEMKPTTVGKGNAMAY